MRVLSSVKKFFALCLYAHLKNSQPIQCTQPEKVLETLSLTQCLYKRPYFLQWRSVGVAIEGALISLESTGNIRWMKCKRTRMREWVWVGVCCLYFFSRCLYFSDSFSLAPSFSLSLSLSLSSSSSSSSPPSSSSSSSSSSSPSSSVYAFWWGLGEVGGVPIIFPGGMPLIYCNCFLSTIMAVTREINRSSCCAPICLYNFLCFKWYLECAFA